MVIFHQASGKPKENVKAANKSTRMTVGALVLILASCRAVWSAELVPLRASYAAVSGAFAPLWLAQDKGLFAKYGLAVELKYILPATATQALLSNSLDIINPGGELIEAGLSGARVAFMVGILNRIVFSLYSKPEIKQFSDLRGKIIGVTLAGSTTDFTARILIQQAGMSPGKDIQVLHLQGMPDIITALTQGRIDAGIVSAPTTAKARQAGFKELVDITARNIPMIHVALATTRDYLKENPDRVRRFLQGYIEGLRIARTDAAQAKQAIGKYTRTENRADLDETYNTFIKAWEPVPYVSAPAVQTLLNFATHPAAKTAKPEQFIDNSIVAELEKSGFIDKVNKQ
jgi:ABC-type nitrate/sulfonate/bicarbonate transport system substrate-binding protein